jgi:hypothetical protein
MVPAGTPRRGMSGVSSSEVLRAESTAPALGTGNLSFHSVAHQLASSEFLINDGAMSRCFSEAVPTGEFIA